jgi:long-chain acyl-CoA synthetase
LLSVSTFCFSTSDPAAHARFEPIVLPDGTVKIIDRLKNVLKLSQGEYVAIEVRVSENCCESDAGLILFFTPITSFLPPKRVENILSRSEFIAQLFSEGSSLKSYLVAIIHPEPDYVKHWASHLWHMKDLSYEELCGTKELNEAVLADMKRLAKQNELHSFEVPKAIFLDPQPFTMVGCRRRG